MPFWRILLTALGAQIVLVGAGGPLIGLAGGLDHLGPMSGGWLDIVNSFALIWLACCILGGLLVFISLEPRPARTFLLILALVGALISGGPIAADAAVGWRDGHASPAPGPVIKVLTFNAWDDSFSADRAIAAIRESDADIVALQETRAVRPLLGQLAKAYPYRTPCEVDCSVMVLSRHPPLEAGLTHLSGASLGPIAYPGFGDVQVAHLTFRASDGQPVTLATTHLFWAVPPPPYRRQQDVLAKFIAGLPNQRLILSGDFNLAPWTFTMRRQDALLRPLHRVTRALPTWPAYLPVSNKVNWLPFLPLDHMYLGPGLQVARVHRMSVYSSDHRPVLVSVRLRADAPRIR